jgi:hypothetical protein
MVYATEVQPLREHWLRVTFTDGAVKEIDLSELLASGGVFAPIYERRELFEQVRAATSLLPDTAFPAARSTSQ